MNPAIERYTQSVDGRYLPPDPCKGDLAVHRFANESVYSVLPITNAGRAFVLEHNSVGSVHGDFLILPLSAVDEILDAMLDEGLRVV